MGPKKPGVKSLSSEGENCGEEPAQNDTEVEEEVVNRETQNEWLKRLRSSWQAVLLGILMVLFCSVTGALFAQINKQQNLTASLQQMAKNNKQLQMNVNHLMQLVNFTYRNLNPLESECSQLNLLLNATRSNFTSFSPENMQLRLLLRNTLQEKSQLSLRLKNTLQYKAQLQVKNKELNTLRNQTLESCNLVKEENRQLNLLLNESLHIIANNDHQTSMQLKEENQHQRSILFSDKLSFLWRFCNNGTLQCSRCLPGWVEHASRCFYLSQEEENWETARRKCLDAGGDLAVVLNAEDQALLTNLTFQFAQQHPQVNFKSVWIGLQDLVKEGAYIWVNGNKIHRDVVYWKQLQPNNALASWATERTGQDCVAIVPPKQIGQGNWLNTWDDIVCSGKRRYLCETMALILS